MELRPTTGEHTRRLGRLDQEDASELQQLLARQQALDRMRIWMLESGLESIHHLHDRAGEDVFPGSLAGKKCEPMLLQGFKRDDREVGTEIRVERGRRGAQV